MERLFFIHAALAWSKSILNSIFATWFSSNLFAELSNSFFILDPWHYTIGCVIPFRGVKVLRLANTKPYVCGVGIQFIYKIDNI